MSFNYQPILKGSDKQQDRKQKFQLPRIPLRGSSVKKRDSEKNHSHGKNIVKAKGRQSMLQSVSCDATERKKILIMLNKKWENIQEQSKMLKKERKKKGVLKRKETQGKGKGKSFRQEKEGNMEVSQLFSSLNEAFDDIEQKRKKQQFRSKHNRDSLHKKSNSNVKRLFLAKQKYKVNMPEIYQKRAALSMNSSAAEVFEQFELHMTNLSELQQRSSNSLKDYIQNHSELIKLKKNSHHTRNKTKVL